MNIVFSDKYESDQSYKTTALKSEMKNLYTSNIRTIQTAVLSTPI